jgi:rare lipoprotein A
MGVVRELLLAALCAAALSGAAQAETASIYWEGRVTATGERFRPDGLTAAHRAWRFGTRVRVSAGARSVVVRINDRGPFHRNKRTHQYDRDIDLARGAARVLGKLAAGVFRVTLQRL